jgi:hypothetical protein
MAPTLIDVLGFLGLLVRFIGFLVFGFAVGKFVMDNYKGAEWQVRIALALGFFALAAALTHFASPGSAGAFALGGGVAFLMAGMPKRNEDEGEMQN